MIKSADKDNTGYVSCDEFSGLLKQNLNDVAMNLDVTLEEPGKKQVKKGKMHRSVIGKKPKGLRSTYMPKRTLRR